MLRHNPGRFEYHEIRDIRREMNARDGLLYAHSDKLEVRNDFDWHENPILLKAALPLSASSTNVTYEIPYGSIERLTTRSNSWEQTKFEVPALRWANLGDAQHGFSLINELKYGYDAVSNLLRLSLLRSPTWPDPQADCGPQHFRYLLYSHAGTWKQALAPRRGYESNYELLARQVSPHTGQPPGVALVSAC